MTVYKRCFIILKIPSKITVIVECGYWKWVNCYFRRPKSLDFSPILDLSRMKHKYRFMNFLMDILLSPLAQFWHLWKFPIGVHGIAWYQYHYFLHRHISMGDGMDRYGRNGRARRSALLLRRPDHCCLLRRLAHAEDHHLASAHRDAYSGHHHEKRGPRQLWWDVSARCFVYQVIRKWLSLLLHTSVCLFLRRRILYGNIIYNLWFLHWNYWKLIILNTTFHTHFF